MEQRIIQDKEEIQQLIISVTLSQKEEFTMAKIVEKVIENETFNRNICSSVELIKKVSEVLDVLVEVGAIKGETNFASNSTERFKVSYIT